MTHSRTYYNVTSSSQPAHRFSKLKQGSVSVRGSEGYRTNNSYTKRHIDVKHTVTLSRPLPTLSPAETEFASWQPPQRAVNRAIRKLQNKLEGDGSQLMTAALEWNSSMRMISARGLQLWSAYRALRNWDLPRVARTLGFSPSAYTQQRVERMARFNRPTEAWLEYWMGWAPLMSDIYNAVDVIQRPPPNQHARASVRDEHFDRSTNYVGAPNQSYYTRLARQKWQYSLYTDVVVTNSNLMIANQLGLINPAQTAWELVPFSFVVDWFTNVGQVLGNLNRFAGLTLTKSGSATRKDVHLERFGADRYLVNPDGPPPYIYSLRYYKSVGVMEYDVRVPGAIPLARLTLELPKLSLTRAATAIGLLTEIFLAGDGKLLKR